MHMHKICYKRICVFLSLFPLLSLSGCQNKSSITISDDKVLPIQQASFCTNIFVGVSDDALYYQLLGGKLFALDTQGNNMQIGSMNFVDDKAVGSSRNEIPAPKRYSEISETSVGMLFFDNQIIYESQYASVDGQIKYHLNAYDPIKNQFQTLIEFDFQPSYFTVQNNVIAVAESIESSDEGIVHFFDLYGNERQVIKFGADIVNITSNGDDIIIFCISSIYAVDIDSFRKSTVAEKDNTAFIYVCGNQYSYYTVMNVEEMYEEDLKVHTGINDITEGKELFGIDNSIIDYFDDSYIYTTTLEEDPKYRIYDWNSELIKEIEPSKTLGSSEGALPIALNEMNFSSIVRVWNQQLIGYHFKESEIELFACDIENAKCRFLAS